MTGTNQTTPAAVDIDAALEELLFSCALDPMIKQMTLERAVTVIKDRLRAQGVQLVSLDDVVLSVKDAYALVRIGTGQLENTKGIVRYSTRTGPIKTLRDQMERASQRVGFQGEIK